jgi:hypothetical protein
MIQPFVISGKAKTVFALIELKAKREQELNEAMNNLSAEVKRTTGHSCPFDKVARCSKPEDISCGRAGCPVWLGLKELERRVEDDRE